MALGVSSSRVGGEWGFRCQLFVYQCSGITVATEGSSDPSLLSNPVWDIHLCRYPGDRGSSLFSPNDPLLNTTQSYCNTLLNSWLLTTSPHMCICVFLQMFEFRCNPAMKQMAVSPVYVHWC